jgi:Ala-tRNA(Pro) deacylase
MPSKNISDLLDNKHIKYVCIKHSPAYTAQELAQTAHIPGRNIAKTVIIKLNGNLAMVVLTANDKINLSKLSQSLGRDNIEIATEREFKDKFPDCEVGAMPPFGNLYHMDVFVDEKLTKDPEIAFNAGSHSELVRMTYADFANLVHPKVLSTSQASLQSSH